MIVQSAEHAARTLLSFRTCRVVDGGTKCMPLSAAVNNPRSAGRVEGPYSMLQVIGVRKPVSRLPRGDCSDQHCCPERAWCAVALSMLEYYVYSISNGQESACGGRVRPHGLAVSAFKQSCPIYSRNEPRVRGVTREVSVIPSAVITGIRDVRTLYDDLRS